MKSIIEGDEKGKCYIEGCTCTPTECHHIFGGPNRKFSEKYGLKVHLCIPHHRGGRKGVHENRELMDRLHEIGQEAFEREHTREEFMQIFGRNYLGDRQQEKNQKTEHKKDGFSGIIWMNE